LVSATLNILIYPDVSYVSWAAYPYVLRGSGGFKSCEALFDRVENNDPQLVELVILPMKAFGEAEVERLAKILSTGKNTHLRSITASGHTLPSSALETLGKALVSPSASKICCIAIGDEGMGDEGVESFCQPISKINGGPIESIDFSFKSITDVGAGTIGRAFGQSKHLKRLDLYRNPGIGDDGMVELCSFASLHAEGGETSHAFQVLEHLDIAENEIGPSGAKAFVDCLTKGATALPRLTQIELQASSNPFGPEGCSYIKSLISQQSVNKSLVKKMSLKKCSIGDKGFVSLVESFQYSCDGFGVLDVSDNGIGTEAMLTLSVALRENETNIKSFKSLNLAKNAIGDDGVMTLAGSLKQNDKRGNSTLEILDLSSTKCGINGAVEVLKCTSLKSVRLFNNNLGSEGFEALTPLLIGGHPTIEHLDLGGNRAKESAVAALLRAVMVKNEPDNSVLQTIELGGNEVGEEVEGILKEMVIVRPELDVARDRPSVDQPNDLQGDERKE
jgi:Ran GTPase-activating protein (RanGAP) involved in mRNA processing and transport